MKERGFFMPENEIHRAVAQIANAIEKNNVLALNVVGDFHESIGAWLISETDAGISSAMRCFDCRNLNTPRAIPAFR